MRGVGREDEPFAAAGRVASEDEALFEGFRAASANAPVDVDAARAELRRVLAEARAAWPDFALTPDELGRAIGARAEDAADLAALRGADLALAIACARGDARAIEAFEAAHGASLDKTLARFAGKQVSLDDLKQLVRAKLFVGEGAPKIALYTGRGELRIWLRVTATRAALNALRAPTNEELDEHLAATLVDPGDSPELVHMKALYREEFKAAFASALAALSPRQRSLLRFAVLGGLDGAKIGAMYNVHRTTAARWVDEARAELSRATLKNLTERLRVPRAEIESILEVIRSNLELSLERCLKGAP